MSLSPVPVEKDAFCDRNVGTLFNCHPEHGALRCFSRTVAYWFKQQKHKNALKPVMIGRPRYGDQ